MESPAFEIAKLVASLLLGGSGYAVIHALLVRPRLYTSLRIGETVRILSARHRQQVETALAAQSVPTGFAEIDWWNQGRRASGPLTIEITSPAPILTWEASLPQDDLLGPWACVRDPGRTGNDSHILLIEQKKLMPRSGCRIVIGYDRAFSDKPFTVRAFEEQRPIPPRPVLSESAQFALTAALTLIPFFVGEGVYVLVTGAFPLGDRSGLALLGLKAAHVCVALIAGLVVMGGFLQLLRLYYPWKNWPVRTGQRVP